MVTLNPARLFTEHHPGLCHYLYRLTGDTDMAADLAQETFARLLERPPGPESARSWLFQVATNLARDHLRAASRRRLLLLSRAGEAPHGDAAPDPLALLEGAERRRRVQKALLALSLKERTALLMREEGFAQREIAEAVGTTTLSVGTLIARAMKKLADHLGLDEETP